MRVLIKFPCPTRLGQYPPATTGLLQLPKEWTWIGSIGQTYNMPKDYGYVTLPTVKGRLTTVKVASPSGALDRQQAIR